jgi:endoglucanase
MLNDADPLKKRLLAASSGMASYLRNNAVPPEKVNVSNGQVEGNAPPGFSAALLPYLHASRQTNAFALQQQRMITKGAGASVPEPLRYYDQVLSLFGQGWIEKRYQFNKTGHLVPRWKLQCSPIKK